MKFNEHTNLEGLHAFLSPSNYHWIGYDDNKLAERYTTYKAAELGTKLHAFASMAIQEKITLAKKKKALYMFVNDAIGFQMESEKVLYFSEFCFGTADAISFRDNTLRIFDLKTGRLKVSFSQLDVYAAIFCLEYGYNPFEITIEERIYQGNACNINMPDPEVIENIMNIIIAHDETLRRLQGE